MPVRNNFNKRWSKKSLLAIQKHLKKKEQKKKQKNKRIKNESLHIIPEEILPNAKGVYAGRRKDIQDDKNKPRHPEGLYLRSRWEANYGRYLMFLSSKGDIARWEYEPDTFWFENIKRGVRSYLPDFKVWDKAGEEPYYVEVKGQMDSRSATKLKRMAKYYPEIRIDVCDRDTYWEIKRKLSGIIPHWET